MILLRDFLPLPFYFISSWGGCSLQSLEGRIWCLLVLAVCSQMIYKSNLRSAYHVTVRAAHFCTSNSWLKTSVPFSFLSCCPLIIPLLSLLAFKDFQPFMDGSSPSIRFRVLLKWYYDKQKVFSTKTCAPLSPVQPCVISPFPTKLKAWLNDVCFNGASIQSISFGQFWVWWWRKWSLSLTMIPALDQADPTDLR